MAINLQNLRPVRSKEEARERGSKGGKASVEARRRRKTLRIALLELMSSKVPKDSPLFGKIKEEMKSLGLKGSPTVQDLATIGLFKRAASGDSLAFSTLRDTLGEKPVEQREDITPPQPIVLGLIPVEGNEDNRSSGEEQHNEDGE